MYALIEVGATFGRQKALHASVYGYTGWLHSKDARQQSAHNIKHSEPEPKGCP